MINVNEYFNGNVKSMSLNSGALPATVGVMLAGKYTFSTAKKEIMTIIQGDCTVALQMQEDYAHYAGLEIMYFTECRRTDD